MNNNYDPMSNQRRELKKLKGIWGGIMKRYDPGLEGPCPELERAVMHENPSGEYVKANDVLAVIKGCFDYGGGYHGNNEHMEIYRHGMQTVLNAMNQALKSDPSDTQSNVLLALGRKAMELPKQQ